MKPNVFDRLPRRFRWTFHNLVAHPMMEVLFQLGFEQWGNRLHDSTAPNGTDVRGE